MDNTLILSLKKFVIAETIGDVFLKACALNEIIPYQRTFLQRVQVNRELKRLRRVMNRKTPLERDEVILRWGK